MWLNFSSTLDHLTLVLNYLYIQNAFGNLVLIFKNLNMVVLQVTLEEGAIQ